MRLLTKASGLRESLVVLKKVLEHRSARRVLRTLPVAAFTTSIFLTESSVDIVELVFSLGVTIRLLDSTANSESLSEVIKTATFFGCLVDTASTFDTLPELQ